jgi:23S rRNA-/tRNA-specific pseudouridylate synthase
MSKRDKLREKFFEKPVRNDITVNEVIRLSKAYGCVILTGGNHQIRICHQATGTIIPIPHHGDTVKEAYIAELKTLILNIEAMNKEGK